MKNLKELVETECLLKILQWTNLKISQSKFESLLNKKNKIYLEKISKLNSSNIIDGVQDFIKNAKEQNHSVALIFIKQKCQIHFKQT